VPVPDPSGKRDVDGTPTLLGKRIEIHPDEADEVRRIFAWAADGVGAGTIVERLNRERIIGPRERRWAIGSVGRILQNERYRGKQIWGQQKWERQPGTSRKVARMVPREQWHVHERPICGSSRMHCGTEFKRCARGNSFVAKQAHQLSPDERCGLYVIGTATQSADPATEVPGEGTHAAAGQIG
jgi:Recombinase